MHKASRCTHWIRSSQYLSSVDLHYRRQEGNGGSQGDVKSRAGIAGNTAGKEVRISARFFTIFYDHAIPVILVKY